MKTLLSRGLFAALFALVSACGGGSGGEQIVLGRPGVNVLGLTGSDSVTLRLQPSGEDMVVSTNGIRTFTGRVPSGTDHTVNVIAVTGTVCKFANGRISSSSNKPTTVHTLYCGEAKPPSPPDPGTPGGGNDDDDDDGTPGGGGGGDDDEDEADLELTLALTDTGGAPLGTTGSPVTSLKPGKVSATFTVDGVPLANAVVTFSTTIGELDPPSGTALTDDNGVATVLIRAGTVTGAGTITASASALGDTATASINFQVQAGGTSGPSEGQPKLTLVLQNNDGDPLGAPGNPVRADKIGEARATLTVDGDPLKNELVRFTTTIGVLEPESGTALTDENGVAEIRVHPGNVTGAGTLSATVQLGDQQLLAKLNFEVTGTASDGGAEGQPELALTLEDNAGITIGSVSDPVTSSRPGVARATLLLDGDPLSNELVTFSTTIGQLEPVSGTALTDGNGVAQVKVLAGDVSGAGTLTATAKVQGTTLTAQYHFQVESDGSSGGGGPVVGVPALGNGAGAGFVEGELSVSTVNGSAGSTINVTATIVDTTNGNANWSEIVEVEFTSSCIARDMASIDSPALAIGGTVSVAYTPRTGCTNDTITASATISGELLTAFSPAITIAQAPPNSIAFIEAQPSIIGLRGSGQAGTPETSTLTFLVKNSNGEPVGSGIDVDFDVVGGTGGFAITSSTTGTTNASGHVMVTVKSGSVPTVGTVRARIPGTGIEATGSVSVQTGVASQERFSIAVEKLNPHAGNHLGETVQVTARAADRFGNWVPDGTRINFTTELGDIEPSCQTENGGCSVTWTSQGPQPGHYDPKRADASRECPSPPVVSIIRKDKEGLLNTVACGRNDRFGRSTITAWTVGEESFEDRDGNNLFSLGEVWIALPEAFRDDNETGHRTDDPGVIVNDFMDFDGDGVYDDADHTIFRGLGCTEDARLAGHCPGTLANVRDSAVVVLSTDMVQMWVYPPETNFDDMEWVDFGDPTVPPESWGRATVTGIVVPAAHPTYTLEGDQVKSIYGRSAKLVVLVADMNGNAPPEGTKVTVNGGDMSVVGPDSCTVESRLEPKICTFSFFYEGTEVGPRKPITVGVDGTAAHWAVDVEIPL